MSSRKQQSGRGSASCSQGNPVKEKNSKKEFYKKKQYQSSPQLPKSGTSRETTSSKSSGIGHSSNVDDDCFQHSNISNKPKNLLLDPASDKNTNQYKYTKNANRTSVQNEKKPAKIIVYDKNDEKASSSKDVASSQFRPPRRIMESENKSQCAPKSTYPPKHFNQNHQIDFKPPDSINKFQQHPRNSSLQSVNQSSPQVRHPGGFRFQSPRGNFRQPRFQNNVRFMGMEQGIRHSGGFPIPRYPSPNQMAQIPKQINSNYTRHNFIPQNIEFQTNFTQNATNVRLPNKKTTRPIQYKLKDTQHKKVNVKQGWKENSQNSVNEKKRRNRKNKIQPKMQEPEPDTSNIVPLLSFQRLNTEPDESFQLIEFSDEDDSFVASQFSDCSGIENVKLIDFSDDENVNAVSQTSANSLSKETLDLIDLSNDGFVTVPEYSVENLASLSFSDDSDSTDESEESEVMSELSMTSSIMDTTSSLSNFNPSISNKEAFISVFWDIENCTLPSKKSAVDFANCVREMFYEGRTEDEFSAACDVSRLSNTVVKELEQASVTLMHICSLNKNAADKRLQSCLQRFQNRHRMSNSAVVLVSSDSDFTHFLLEMRYKHHIYINLICGASTKRSLITAANKCVQFEDILQKLPNRSVTDNMQYILLVSNLPQMTPKAIKNSLSEKLKSFNCRIKFINNISSVEIIFQDHSICQKAMTCLKGYYLGGNAISYIYQERLNEDENNIPKKVKNQKQKSKKEKSGKKNLLQSDLLLDISCNLPSDSQKDKVSDILFDNTGNIPSISQKDKVSDLLFDNIGNIPSVSQKDKSSDLLFDIPCNVLAASQKDKASDLLLDISCNLLSDSQKNKESNCENEATLSIVVSICLGEIEYWKETLEKIIKMSDFALEWEGGSFDGCLLIHFKSLKKAQKAKKIIQKNQLNDPNAPKFLKLIKHKELCNFKMEMNSIEETNKRKINEHMGIIEKKTASFLRKHQNVMKKIMLESKSEVHGVSEAVNDKLNECNEQMETFKNFSKHTVESMKSLSYNSETLEQELNDLLCDFIRECNCISSALPIYAKKDLILRRIKAHQVIIIRAETGSGKSTQLSQYIWRDRNSFRNGKVICTQPRKIAAISLAKHVSSQIGSNVGEIVGYQVGMSNKTSINTGILYVTDFTMLKMIITESLDDISCIIIDEAHERTIYTDILLGIIKSYLPSYPHLKVVITSATIDTSIFQDYFNLNDDSVLHISGRAFPIEDIWLDQDVPPCWEYFSRTINTALELLTEEPGDILSFLTTPLETEKAAESFSEKLKVEDRKKVKVFNLHGKLNAQEQQKVFEKTPESIRKVVFATNCAETSITIPGIRYVIDCGMVKESQFDVSRNMNVLTVGFVSKSSAEQRRGRAGRTQVGKCYHLYSQANYAQMAENTKPEILRINLGQALLKLMKMGISDPIQFDFVQSPPKDLLISTMEQLIYLKAVDKDNGLLTDLGSNMAVLPLEPRLCHLIFQGILNDVGYEALAVAALITSSSTIFYRNTENKDIADKKKTRFCEFENDFLTYLEVYKEWLDVPKRLKSHWCVTNCINGRAMTVVHELINEIVLVLQNELSYKVKSKFENDSYDTLIRVIFHSFSLNLSVYSGHFKFGYKSLNMSDRLLIHPSSSLCAFGRLTPKYVIYDTILKTTQNFMMNVCPVTRDLVLEAISMHGLNIDFEALEDLIATEFCISPLGEKMICYNFIGKKGIKQKEILIKVKDLINSDSVEMDISISEGSVKIVGYGSEFGKIESIVAPIISDAQQKLYAEERDICLFEDISPFTAILAAGGRFKDVILPGEFRDIKIRLKGSADINSVMPKLLECGSVTEIREWKKYFKVTFEFPAFAEKALEMYRNETEFSLQSIERSASINTNYLYKVFISFLRRKCTGLAFISLDKDSSITDFSLPSVICYRDTILKVSKNKKTDDIRIFNLPEDTDKKDLESKIASLLPLGVKMTKCIVVRLKPYESTKTEMDAIKEKMLQLFLEFTFKENIQVELKKPTSKDVIWNATAYFKNLHDGETAVNVLKSRKNVTDFASGVVFKPILQTYLYCKSAIFSAVKDEINEALQFFKQDLSPGSSLDIKAISKGVDKVEIKITSNNVSDISDARRSIHTILSGDEIKFSENLDQEKLFTDPGKEFMKKLSIDFQDCYIFQNVYTKTITLFGKVNACNIIKMKINSFLRELENEEYKDITLKTDSGKSVLKELFKNYGYDLSKLKEECDASDIQVNKYKQILTIQGNSSSVTMCESIIQDIKKILDDDDSENFEEICPVCCDEVSNEKHRLEYCGHAYCTECLLHLFQSSENIPLSCEHSSEHGNCYAPIVVMDLVWAVNGRKTLEKNLYEKFLRSFVQSRSDISCCPTPDCPMVFRVTKKKMNIYKCPACSNDICTRCEVLYHFGMDCSLYKCVNSSTDYSLKAWIQESPSNRKQCPSCSSPIEKNGGCNHMTCWKCKCHMCWLCLQVFLNATFVYDHLPHCPKN